MQVLLYLLMKNSGLVKYPLRLRANMKELMLCCGWQFSGLSVVTPGPSLLGSSLSSPLQSCYIALRTAL